MRYKSLLMDRDVLRSDVSDWLQFAPILPVYLMGLSKGKTVNPFWKRTNLLLQSELLMVAIVRPLKVITNVSRPENRDNLSMPSGHAAQTFVAATFFHKELGKKSIWYSIAGYSAASTVGIFRVLSNRHWLGDTLVGAGIGILATNLVYLPRKPRRRKCPKNTTFIPSVNSNGLGVYLSYKL